jgi:hypothetical protein
MPLYGVNIRVIVPVRFALNLLSSRSFGPVNHGDTRSAVALPEIVRETELVSPHRVNEVYHWMD